MKGRAKWSIFVAVGRGRAASVVGEEGVETLFKVSSEEGGSYCIQ
jgi:hypothetical protein